MLTGSLTGTIVIADWSRRTIINHVLN